MSRHHHALLLTAALFALPAAARACNANDATGVDILDARVFNWQYYLNQHGDLPAAGITTAFAARNHWRNFGLCEGRQAHPNFHAPQYLAQYSDLRAAFGSNAALALKHYLTFGIGEGRSGYGPNEANGTYGRWTARNAIISITASHRVAGAVDSVFWNGKEMINSYDHGRQLQPALSKNGYGECYNPTLAGSSADGVGPGTTSILQAASVTQNRLQTQALPAFWLAPFTIDPRGQCGAVVNTTDVSAYRTHTDVTVGLPGMAHAMRYITTIYVPEAVTSLTIEAPTGYLTGDMTAFYTYTDATQSLQSLSPSLPMGEQGKPLVLSTPNGSHAMGIWSPGLPQPQFATAGYGQFRFPSSNESNSTMKWNAVYRTGAVAAGTTLSYTSYVAVGSLENVRVTLAQLHQAWRNGQL
jgi:hypothetical protein